MGRSPVTTSPLDARMSPAALRDSPSVQITSFFRYLYYNSPQRENFVVGGQAHSIRALTHQDQLSAGQTGLRTGEGPILAFKQPSPSEVRLAREVNPAPHNRYACFAVFLLVGASCVTIWINSTLSQRREGSQAEQCLGRPLSLGPFTYGGDHCACQEETAPRLPVTGVGGVAVGVHIFSPGFQDAL